MRISWLIWIKDTLSFGATVLSFSLWNGFCYQESNSLYAHSQISKIKLKLGHLLIFEKQAKINVKWHNLTLVSDSINVYVLIMFVLTVLSMPTWQISQLMICVQCLERLTNLSELTLPSRFLLFALGENFKHKDIYRAV